MGLIHPVDLDAWQAWQARRSRWVSLRSRLRGERTPAPLVLTTGGPDARVLVAIDSRASSSVAAYVEPLRRLRPSEVAVLAAEPRRDLVGDRAETHEVTGVGDVLARMPGLSAALSAGNYLRAGALAHDSVVQAGGTSFVGQHGLLTPHAPPLPSRCTLLAWSHADAEFWRSGRDDIEVVVVGSQLLWDAAHRDRAEVDEASPPTFLGQLHGAEIPRREMAAVSYSFCRANRATYRPHPSEVDKLSRLQHAVWKRRGVRFDNSGVALADLSTPVVGVFSTGLLEAAAAGKPAWAFHPNPPSWVADLWRRYGLNQWGGEPTAAPPMPATEPATRIGEILRAPSTENTEASR